MARTSLVFPEITLVIDGQPRRMRSLIPRAPLEDTLVMRRPRRRRAWPIYIAAIAIGIGVGLVAKTHPRRGHAAPPAQIAH